MRLFRTHTARLLIGLVLCLSMLVSCAGTYPSVKSTEEEATVLYTATFDGKRYEIRYELWRALAAQYVTVEDGLSESELRQTVDARVLPIATELLATFALAASVDIPLDSKSVRTTIEGFLAEDIEPYGSYNAYLDALSSMYVNYEAMMTMYRYAVAQALLEEHYYGVINPLTGEYMNGVIDASATNVHAFYNAEGTMRAVLYRLPYAQFDAEERALTYQTLTRLYAEEGEGAVHEWLLRYTTMVPEEAAGTLLTADARTLTHRTLAAITAELPLFGFSEPVDVPEDEAFYLVWRLDKPSTYLDEYAEQAADAYRSCTLGAALAAPRRAMTASLTRTAAFPTASVAFLSTEERP